MLILTNRSVAQPQTAARLAEYLPPGSFVFNGGTGRIIGAKEVAAVGALTQGQTIAGKYWATASSSSRLDAGIVPQAQPGAMTVIAAVWPSASNVLQYVGGTVSTGTAYLEHLIVNGDNNSSLLAGAINYRVRVDGTNDFSASIASNVIVANTVPQIFAFRWLTATTMECFVDGIQKTITYTNIGTTPPAQQNTEFSMGVLNRNVRGAWSEGQGSNRVLLFARIPSIDVDIQRLTSSYKEVWGLLERRKIIIPMSIASGNTAALTGNSSTASQGVVIPSITKAITGNSSTASQGTVTPSITKAITGNAATATQGTVTPAITVALTGNSATATQGSVTPQGTFSAALSGQAATTAVGTPTAALSLAITGNTATAAQGTLSPVVTKAITGNAATATQGTVAPVITVALTGNSATATQGTVTPQGTFAAALSGQAATTAAGSVSPNITVAITGNTATASVGSITVLSPFTVALTGNSATTAVGVFGHALTIALTGVSATASIGSLGVGGWAPIDPSQGSSWAPVGDSQAGSWAPVVDTQVSSWTPI